jgi:hypothetical protein
MCSLLAVIQRSGVGVGRRAAGAGAGAWDMGHVGHGHAACRLVGHWCLVNNQSTTALDLCSLLFAVYCGVLSVQCCGAASGELQLQRRTHCR